LISFTKIDEESVRERTNAASRVINTVIGMYARNLPSTQGKNIIGRNAESVVSVPLISGDLKSRIASIIADTLLYQSFVFSLAHSIITITVSIAIQSVKTSEKLVKKFKLSHRASSTINVIIKASGSSSVATIDSLNPTNTSMVKNTSTRVNTAVSAKF
jgi:hypothetical protein